MIRVEHGMPNSEEPIFPVSDSFAKNFGVDVDQGFNQHIQELIRSLPVEIQALLEPEVDRSEVVSRLEAYKVPTDTEVSSVDRIKVPTKDRYIVVTSFVDGSIGYALEGTE